MYLASLHFILYSQTLSELVDNLATQILSLVGQLRQLRSFIAIVYTVA